MLRTAFRAVICGIYDAGSPFDLALLRRSAIVASQMPGLGNPKLSMKPGGVQGSIRLREMRDIDDHFRI